MSLECSPVWVLLWSVKSPNWEKVLSHSSHCVVSNHQTGRKSCHTVHTCMGYLMSCQVTRVCECLVTLVTLERFLPCNTLYALSYVLSSDQSLWMPCYTCYTWKVALLYGLFYVLSGDQSLWIPRYTERFLPCVESHMSCQSPGHNIVLLGSLGVSGKWVWEAST